MINQRQNELNFKRTRYTVISHRKDNNEITSYCSMGNQKFYVEDIDCLRDLQNKIEDLMEISVNEDKLK